MAISLLRDNIFGVWLVTFLYGIHFVVFIGSIYVILSRSRRSTYNGWLFTVSTLLFLCATTQMICTLIIATMTTDLTGEIPVRTQMFAKVTDGVSSRLAANELDEQKLSDEKNLANLIICIEYAVTIANVLVTDGLLIWRCFMVWGKRWTVVIIPIILLLAGSGVGFDITVVAVKMYLIRYRAPASASLPLPGWDALMKQVGPLAGACYTIYFVNNVSITTLIAWRIWSSARGISKHLRQGHARRYWSIMHLIIESGSLYALALFILAILCWLNSPLWGFFEDLANGLAGIIPTLVIVLVGLNRQTPTNINNEVRPHSLPPLEFRRPAFESDIGLHIDLDNMAKPKGHSLDMSDSTGTAFSRRAEQHDVI